MHGIYQAKAFLDAALLDAVLDFGRDIHKTATAREIEDEFVAMRFHEIFFTSLFWVRKAYVNHDLEVFLNREVLYARTTSFG
jgi:hypothetical protein